MLLILGGRLGDHLGQIASSRAPSPAERPPPPWGLSWRRQCRGRVTPPRAPRAHVTRTRLESNRINHQPQQRRPPARARPRAHGGRPMQARTDGRGRARRRPGAPRARRPVERPGLRGRRGRMDGAAGGGRQQRNGDEDEGPAI
eukprot:scaffold942_cov366-Prasinococcus_capsulatus_cf.AAC.7